MGKKPDDLQQELAQRRSALTTRANGLRDRVHSDIGTLRTVANDDVAGAVRRVSDGAKAHQLAEAIDTRPLTSVTVGLAAGALLGWTTGHAEAAAPRAASGASGPSFFASTLATVTDAMSGTVRTEASSVLRTTVEAILDSLTKAEPASPTPQPPQDRVGASSAA